MGAPQTTSAVSGAKRERARARIFKSPIRLLAPPHAFHSRNRYRRAVKVRHGKSERIRGVADGRLGQSKNDAHHLRHLRLFGAPAPGDRLLHPRRRIFVDVEPGTRAHEKRDAPSMAKLGRRLSVLREEDRLDARFVGGMGRDDFHECQLDHDEPRRDRGSLVRVHDAVRRVEEPGPSTLDDAPPEMAGPRIQPENGRQSELASLASSSSEMSKSAYTFCTSSWSSSASAMFRATCASLPETGFFILGTYPRELDLGLMAAFSRTSTMAPRASGGVVRSHSSPVSW